MLLDTHMDANMQLTINSFWTLFLIRFFPDTSLTCSNIWQVSKSLTFPGFPDKVTLYSFLFPMLQKVQKHKSWRWNYSGEYFHGPQCIKTCYTSEDAVFCPWLLLLLSDLAPAAGSGDSLQHTAARLNHSSCRLLTIKITFKNDKNIRETSIIVHFIGILYMHCKCVVWSLRNYDRMSKNNMIQFSLSQHSAQSVWWWNSQNTVKQGYETKVGSLSNLWCYIAKVRKWTLGYN